MRLKILILSLVCILSAGSAVAQVPTTASPSTQPVEVIVKTENPKSSAIAETFGKTDIAKFIRGEKEVTLHDVTQLWFWVGTIQNFAEAVVAFIPRLLVAVIFLFVFWLIYRALRKLAMGSMNKAKVDDSIREMLVTLIRWTVMGFGVVIACNQLGIPIVAMLTGVSIIGLAVGFAAQETLANFIAGIVIFLDKPFKVGDWVEHDGAFGQVQRISFRSTRILNLDGEVIVFPNSHMLASKVSNHSTNPINRVNISIGIAYKESIDAARDALIGTTKGDERLCSDPPPTVVVDQCADSSVNLLLRFWIKDESVEKIVKYEYLEKAKNALDAAGIQIPFPHMQVLVEETPAVTALAAARGRAA